jgi:hypothetical protein
MVATPDHAAHEAISRRGPAALAWEVLRRDPAYRADYQLLAELPATAITPEVITTRWGLHFR